MNEFENITVYKNQYVKVQSVKITVPLIFGDEEEEVKFTTNNRELIHRDSKERIRIVGRERYPVKTYASASENMVVKHLPTSSFWSIQDYKTGETVVDYDETYTKLSCDGSGNYFDIWMDQLDSDRRYKFLIKSVTGGGNIRKIFDDDLTFKIVD